MAERKPTTLSVAWSEDETTPAAAPAVDPAPRKPRAPRKAAPKKAAPPKAAAEPLPAASPPAADVAPAQLTQLAADPVAFVEQLPAVKRGAARRALNLDVPGDLGEWWVKWCRDAELAQRDVFRALLLALRADVEQAAGAES